MRRPIAVALAVLALSCAAAPPEVPYGPPVTLPPEDQPAKAGPLAPAALGFQNEGGLYMPEQVGTQREALQQLGLKIDPAQLSDPLSDVLSAIVNFGGCSASFISAGGLVATNHHCSIAALQHNSTPQANLLKDGFLAKSQKDERFAGPTARIYVTRALRDVSDAVRAALAPVADDLARERALEKFEKEAVAACEKDRPGTRCDLKSFYGGLRYYLVDRLELRDVRLVYAPPSGIGNYGGEVDNWRWPRHTGDFTLFRAYVAPDGKASDHRADNVPYRPAHHLELATRPLGEGDLAIVAGYPGRTSMLTVAKELENTVSWLYPRRLAMFEQYLAAIEAVTASDPDAKIKGVGWVRRFNNFLTKHKGELEGIERGQLLERKRQGERDLRAYIASDPERRQRYGAALNAIEAAIAERDRTREPDTQLSVEILMPRLVWAASLIVRMAEERQKPDAERDPQYQARKIPDLRDELDALDKRYHPKLDQALLTLALERAARAPATEQTPALALIAGANPRDRYGIAGGPGSDSIKNAVRKLYAGTRLADARLRRKLFDKATSAELAKSTDSLIRLALALRPLQREIEERGDRFTGKLLVHEAAYMAALLAQKGGRVPPDANGTLRLSFGVVRGPEKGGGAFTWLSEVVAKNTGKEPFDAPKALLDAAAARRFGPYAVEPQSDVPVDFLTDLQITNGNSGSATLDADGRLTGLAFDGTYESVSSDWVFLPSTRSIHVDVRYLLWVLDAVANADWILDELGVKARVP